MSLNRWGPRPAAAASPPRAPLRVCVSDRHGALGMLCLAGIPGFPPVLCPACCFSLSPAIPMARDFAGKATIEQLKERSPGGVRKAGRPQCHGKLEREAQWAMGRGVQAKNTGSAALSERQKLPRVHASKPGCLMEALKSPSHSQAALPRFPKSPSVPCAMIWNRCGTGRADQTLP